jgi:regulatory protein
MTRAAKTPRGTAKDRALRLLGVRWRSRAELDERLRLAGFERDDIEVALEDLTRAGLVDDARFARAVVADRAGRRLSGDRAIRSALFQKGVSAEVAATAMEAAGDEAERALELARKRSPRLAGSDPAAAFRRLYGLLLRRGFGPGVAREACRAALAEVLAEALAEAPGAAEELTEG